MSRSRAWKCEVCGFIHQGEAPPDQCPICGVGSEMFSLLEAPAPKPEAAAAASWRCTICDYVHRDGAGPPDKCPVCGAAASLFEPRAEPAAAGPKSADVKRIIVVGAGIAGVTAAEHARHTSPAAIITVVSKEEGLPYFRLNLTRLLAGEVDEASLCMQPESWFDEQRIELCVGEVTGIDRAKRQVALGDGQTLAYDRLILASGAHAFVPPIAGAMKEGVFTLRSKADVDGILERASSAQSCVVLGGGVLGLEAAGALARRNLAVTLLEGFGWLLPRQLSERAGRLLQDQIASDKLVIRSGVTADVILGDERARAMRLKSGEEIAADLIIIATGVRPNSYLARQSGLEVDRGVIVDDGMRTSDHAVLAAGDIAEHRGAVHGIWPVAYAQGMTAGVNAAGGEVEMSRLAPSNRLKVLDVDMYSIGQFMPADGSYDVFEHEHEGSYYRFVFHDGRLVGANLLGDTALAGVVKTAVEQGTQLAELSDLSEHFPKLLKLT